MIKHWIICLGSSICLACMMFLACDLPTQPEYGPDHPDPNPTGLNPAELTGINPVQGYLKSNITIDGSGFHAVPGNNMVVFGSKVGKVVSASENQLVVTAPNIAGETVQVKVAVKGSEFWSNAVDFTFLDALTVIADEEINWPNGIEADDAGNVYVGSAGDGMIYRYASDGTVSDFAEVPVNGSIGWGPGGDLYVCEAGEGKIVSVSLDGQTITDIVELEGPRDFDWADNGNMYIIANGAILLFDGAEVTELLYLEGEAKSCRVFADHLYVTEIWGSTIWKFPVTAGGIGEGEAIYEGDSPCALEVDSEGTVYFSEAWETTLHTIKADGSSEDLFIDELLTPMRYFTFHGKFLYIVYPGWGDVGSALRVYIGVEQAPNYGMQQ